MTFWIDAQLSPSVALWITNTFGFVSHSVNYLGLRNATDETIFWAARQANVVVITKDNDFVKLVERRGESPKLFG